MPANIAFYVHHHGTGHLMRCIAISRALEDCRITFLGSHLAKHKNIVPRDVECIDLPMDIANSEDIFAVPGTDVGHLHYAPLNIAGIRKRVNLLTGFFNSVDELLLVVDVSVEVTMLARLCGVPTIVIKQHGVRDDPAHRAAYQSAEAILAPYGKLLASNEPEWLKGKTFYSGGFSRYAPVSNDYTTHPPFAPFYEPAPSIGLCGLACNISGNSDFSLINKNPVYKSSHNNEHQNHLAVITGTGGTSLDLHFLSHLAQQCPMWNIEVLGIENTNGTALPDNIIFHGRVDDPREVLKRASVVIGNAGHNTVMEMAELKKRFIAVPEQRPFDEQLQKAELLESLRACRKVLPAALFSTDWNKLLQETVREKAEWKNIIDPQAVNKAADFIRTIYAKNFSRPAEKDFISTHDLSLHSMEP